MVIMLQESETLSSIKILLSNFKQQYNYTPAIKDKNKPYLKALF